MSSIQKLKEYFENNKWDYKENEPLKNHTTFRIGGNAALYIPVNCEEQIKDIILKCNELEVKHYVLGNGSNVLFSDNDYEGVVISTSEHLNIIRKIDENSFECDAGVKTSQLCNYALENSLSGFEFMWGIPGTVGGAIITNAGAYGGETSDVAIEVKHIDDETNFGSLIGEEIDFSYRHSAYESNNYIITSVVFVGEKGDSKEIKAKMDDLIGRRKSKQPLEFPSAGSVFKRPTNGYAAALIEDAGLKGVSVGGAQVSEKHSGFIVNTGTATCEDVLGLIKIVKEKVFEHSGIKLECEVRIID